MARIIRKPDGRVEVERIANVGVKAATATCPDCKRTICLIWNDPELNTRECCGYQFSLETMRVDVVMYKLPPDPSKEFLSNMTPFEASAR